MALTGSQPAYSMAQGGVMRGGSSRGNVHSSKVFITIGGVHVGTGRAVSTQRVKNETLTITEREGDTPNTCAFEVTGFQPTDGQDVVITLGSKNTLDRWFAGTILRDAHAYFETPTNGHDTVNVIDYTWPLTRRTITQRWQTTSATVIARAIIALAPGFTSVAVAEGLPVLDEFTVTDQTLAGALGALCQRIGGYWKPTYRKDVRLGLTTDTSQTDPTTLTAASALLTRMNDFRVTRDLSQVITQQPVEGGGSTALTAVAAGETILPVADASWYNVGGGAVASGPQRIVYTAVQPGGPGSLVGLPAAPAAAPSLLMAAGAGVESGAHDYAVTFVTAAGETVPSPRSTIAVGAAIADPATGPTGMGWNTGSSPFCHTGGDAQRQWAYTWTTAVGETLPSPTGTPTPFPLAVSASAAGVFATGPAGVTGRKVYRTVAGGAQLKLQQTVANNTAGTFTDHTLDGALGANAPSSNTTAGNQVTLSAIPLGPATVTSRKVYRTTAGGATLKLVATIANNTATTYTDSTADASLGATAPSGDTSGLTIVAGQVNAGSPSLPTAGVAAFASAGGWAIIGHQVIRYTGITDNTLTGIPATGTGAIATSVPYGSQVVAAAALLNIPATGDGAIVYPIPQGDPVNLRVTVEDLDAQAVIAALMGGTDDGVIVGPLIKDGRISETEARARGRAVIALRKTLEVGVHYTTQDINAHAGRTAGVNLPAPTNVVGSFKLQQVTITGFQRAGWPTATVEASSRRFTLEDLLRAARKAA